MLAAMLSLPTLSNAESKPTQQEPSKQEQNYRNQGQEKDHQPQHQQRLPAHLALHFGYSLNADHLFRRASASAYVNSLLMTFGYREKTNLQEKPGMLEVGGLLVEGKERAELHEFDFSFGLEIYGQRWKSVDLTCFGEVTGGIQEGITKLRTETETIPGAPSIDFLLGGGLKVEGVLRLPQRYTKIPLGVGVGVTLEYLNEQIEDLPQEDHLRKFQLGGYVLLRFAKGR
ncbi:MAG: hypothetical protein AABX13_00205 [Nanoarchaeota archaeon]